MTDTTFLQTLKQDLTQTLQATPSVLYKTEEIADALAPLTSPNEPTAEQAAHTEEVLHEAMLGYLAYATPEDLLRKVATAMEESFTVSVMDFDVA